MPTSFLLLKESDHKIPSGLERLFIPYQSQLNHHLNVYLNNYHHEKSINSNRWG